jgi:hypothetical protein
MATHISLRSNTIPNIRLDHTHVFTLDIQNADGIDIGFMEHWMAVHGDCSRSTVRKFGANTEDLKEIAKFLKANRI